MKSGNAKGGLTRIYYGYRKGAKRRGLEFLLTKEEFAGLTKENCWYCGRPPAQISKDYRYTAYYIYNGVDRVDNDKGYILSNCIPCCGTCNRMKYIHSGEDFINQIRKIARNLNIT